MYMISVLKHLIHQEACFPALKLVWDDQVDAKEFGELPKLTPSHYINENRMSTEERHALLSRQQRKMSYRKQGAEVVIEPPIIVFQSFQFGETYSFPIVVRNVSKNSQKVALLMDESHAFKFDECSERVAKFPCGMCMTATITFTPASLAEDCYHRLVVSANTTKVAVPIIALGARPMLNTPDALVIPDAPVRHWTVKPVTVLNSGKRAANFTLNTTGAFCVKPEKGIVPPGQAYTFEVSYYSETIGFHEGEVCLKFDNGEKVYMYLRANAVNCKINLSAADVRCDDTYIGLQTRSSFFIENNSSITARFYWKINKTPPEKSLPVKTKKVEKQGSLVTINSGEEECDEDPLAELQIIEEDEQEGTAEGFQDLDIFQCDIDQQLSKIKAGPDHLFDNDNFNIYPLFGEIKPNSKAEVHVVFSPTDFAFYESMAHLDISGLDKRLPFKFYGRGLGAKFRFGFEVLDVGDVALGGAHTYECPVQNISEIPGSVQFEGLVGAPSGMGMKIEPLSLDISPGQYAAFYVNFTCTGKPGPFEDEMKFSIRQTGNVFYITVRGQITYPSIRFANIEAHMGNLSFGFPKIFSIPLVNDSLNFVNVELKMESDGVDPYIDYNMILKSYKQHNHFRHDKTPAEFKINPCKFTLRPKGLQTVQLTIYPNKIGEVKNKLNCWITDEEGNDVETVAATTVRGTVIVPQIQPVQDIVYLKECYLQFPYTAEFKFRNASELPFIYSLVQKPNTTLKIESENFFGVADPWIETSIPFEVVCTNPGEAFASFDLFAVGNDPKMMSFNIRCNSIPSKVEASNKNVDFGRIEVMDEKMLTVDIINTSPLNFPFTASIFLDEPSDKGETWKVEPEVGLLPAQSRLTFMVTLLLKEVGYHYGGFRIQMVEPLKHVIEVRMKALGTGSPAIFTPPLEKHALVDFGTIFVKQEKTLEYEIFNAGVNTRVLEWKPVGDRGPTNRPWETKNLKKQAAAAKETEQKFHSAHRKTISNNTIGSTHTSQALMKKASPKEPFVINPLKMVLPPGGTAKMTISTYSPTSKTLEETWNLWSFVPATKGLQVDEEDEERGSTTKKYTTTSSSVKKVGNAGKGDKDKARKIPAGETQNLHLRPVIIHEAKLFAVFEAPGLRFSKKIINFIIEATPTHENYIKEETLKIENVGTLPLKVNLHTRFPFSFCQRLGDDTPTEDATYHFDTHKSISFKVHFDGRHLRKELGVVMFDGRLEVHYESLQHSEFVELHGEVRFPQVEMDPPFIDFGTITNGMEAVEQILVTNTGPFCLTYKWYIKPGCTEIHKSDEPGWMKEFCMDAYIPSMKHRLFKFKHKNSSVVTDSLAGTLVRISTMVPKNAAKSLIGNLQSSAVASRENIAHALGLTSGALYKQESNYEDFTQFLEEKMYRSRMMEFMGLKDAEFEAEDEVNYLAYYNQNSSMPKEEFNVNEIIDIIPLAGVIESGKSQSFTVVFYGYPDIEFKTSLVLYIEGGARKTVEISAKTVPPLKNPFTDY